MLAETRFCNALEKALGGPEGVARAYMAWYTAAESEQAKISAETANLATRWAKTAEMAREAGLQGLSDGESGYFEVRLS